MVTLFINLVHLTLYYLYCCIRNCTFKMLHFPKQEVCEKESRTKTSARGKWESQSKPRVRHLKLLKQWKASHSILWSIGSALTLVDMSENPAIKMFKHQSVQSMTRELLAQMNFS